MSDERIQPNSGLPLRGKPAIPAPANLQDIEELELADEEFDPVRPSKTASTAAHKRKRHLREIAGALFVIGLLLICYQAFFLFSGFNDIRNTRQPNSGQSDALAIAGLIIFNGGAILVGLLFMVSCFLIQKFPITISAVCLFAYLLLQVVALAVDPWSFVRGVIFKVIVMGALVRALYLSIAAWKEEQSASPAWPDPD